MTKTKEENKMIECPYCGENMKDARSCSANNTIKFKDGLKIHSISYTEEERCHDCNVEPGGYHHPGCDVEQCPRCGFQLISCECEIVKGGGYG